MLSMLGFNTTDWALTDAIRQSNALRVIIFFIFFRFKQNYTFLFVLTNKKGKRFKT